MKNWNNFGKYNRNFLDQVFKNEIISYFDAPEEVKSIGTKINGIEQFWTKLWVIKIWHKNIFWRF